MAMLSTDTAFNWLMCKVLAICLGTMSCQSSDVPSTFVDIFAQSHNLMYLIDKGKGSEMKNDLM